MAEGLRKADGTRRWSAGSCSGWSFLYEERPDGRRVATVTGEAGERVAREWVASPDAAGRVFARYARQF